MYDNYDVIVIGAGLAGSVIAERFAERSKKRVLVWEKEDDIGGHCKDHASVAGIIVHNHGPHIFHTDDEFAWAYLSRFTDWHPYIHEVKAMVDGIALPLPFNFDSIDLCFSPTVAREMKESLVSAFGIDAAVSLSVLREAPEESIRGLAEYVYTKIFLNYTMKQWGGKRPEDVDSSVIDRVPIRINSDRRYFSDRFQGIPIHGYSAMMHKMLSHPLIEVQTGVDAVERLEISGTTILVEGSKFNGIVIYTGMIDEAFDYAHGPLPYRSLRLVTQTITMENFQETAVINYPNEHSYTRVTEFKHFQGNPPTGGQTVIVKEYPDNYKKGINAPYYIIPGRKSSEIANAYTKAALNIPGFYPLGRLGEYTYFNMDQVVTRALQVHRDIGL